ncbi:hypothetical protein [Enterocloster citroniae]
MKSKKDLKLIYIDAYFRINEMENGKPVTHYATITGTVSGGFSKADYMKYRNLIKEEHEKDGYTDIVIHRCSKEEFELNEEKEDAPIGYIRAYFNTLFTDGEKEMYAPFGVEYDFNKFFGDEIWNMITNSLNSYYIKKGMTNVRTMSITEEYFDYLDMDSDETTIFNFNEICKNT